MTTTVPATTPEEHSRLRAGRSPAVRVLRALLWLGVIAAACASVGLGSLIHEKQPDYTTPDLPDMNPIAQVGMIFVIAVCTVVAVPMLVALRKPRPWLARVAILLVTLAWTAVSVALWKDIRGNWSCSEMAPSVFVAPLWLGAIAVLAASPSGIRALGLSRGPLSIGVRVLILGACGGLVAGNGACLFGCEKPGDAVLAKLRNGQPRAEALSLLDAVCDQTGNAPNGDLRFVCAPRGPAACAFAPAPAREVTLGVGPGDLLVRLTTRTVVGTMRRPR